MEKFFNENIDSSQRYYLFHENKIWFLIIKMDTLLISIMILIRIDSIGSTIQIESSKLHEINKQMPRILENTVINLSN